MPPRRPGRGGPDLIVVGGGIAGIAAAHHAAFCGLSVACFDGAGVWGGQVANVERLDGWPGAPTSGTDLAVALVEAARALGVVFHEEPAAELRLGGTRHTVTAASGTTLQAGRVIVATGARLARLGVPGEDEHTGRGVSQCASCDGALFRGEDVVVVGGGDAACQEALVLAPLCRTVTVVTAAGLTAKRRYVDALGAAANVAFRWDSTVSAIRGDGRGVAAVTVRNLKSGTEEEVAAAGVFPFVGVVPDTGWLPEALPRDAGGRLVVDGGLATPVAGVFAAGACRAGFGGQVAQAAADGVTAAEGAARG